jgi:hypothetical protein
MNTKIFFKLQKMPIKSNYELTKLTTKFYFIADLKNPNNSNWDT